MPDRLMNDEKRKKVDFFVQFCFLFLLCSFFILKIDWVSDYESTDDNFQKSKDQVKISRKIISAPLGLHAKAHIYLSTAEV